MQNPLRILQRVKMLQEDLPKVQEDWNRVMAAKQTIIDLARAQQVNHRHLLQLQNATSVNLPVMPLTHFESRLSEECPYLRLEVHPARPCMSSHRRTPKSLLSDLKRFSRHGTRRIYHGLRACVRTCLAGCS